LFVENANEDFKSVGILEDFQERWIHGKMLYGFEHLNQTFGFK